MKRYSNAIIERERNSKVKSHIFDFEEPSKKI